MTAPVVGGLARLAMAAGGGAILSHCWGRDGNFIAVALGIVAYGVINAMGVNSRSWRAPTRIAALRHPQIGSGVV